ncbi:MAG: asparagine synthase C-terminal domain-containing protein [archaeon]
MLSPNELNEIIENLDIEFSDSCFEKELYEALDRNCFGDVVFFSGGVDSTLLAYLANKKKKVICCTCGIPGAEDLIFAEKVCEKMNWLWQPIIVEDLKEYIKEVMRITHRKDPLGISLGLITYLILSSRPEKVFISGLGAEDLFAGYSRFKKAKNYDELHKMLYDSLKELPKRDYEKDYLIARELGKEIIYPFLSKEVLQIAMKIHPKYKLGDQNKLILRKIASKYIPDFSVYRIKRAAQFGSGFWKKVKKILKEV